MNVKDKTDNDILAKDLSLDETHRKNQSSERSNI